ncbi:hypothetical protein A2U01_0001960 [Trifolium medium]|uniref:Uncharacterized protein n=1 Tax=Trifolium medium TaxID=97028 RepID=A0A392M1F8_9FABA|nr:hypothetical protein [Trifolium medium]
MFSNCSAPSTFSNRFALFLSQKPICSVPSSLLLTSVLVLFISVSALHFVSIHSALFLFYALFLLRSSRYPLYRYSIFGGWRYVLLFEINNIGWAHSPRWLIGSLQSLKHGFWIVTLFVGGVMGLRLNTKPSPPVYVSSCWVVRCISGVNGYN